MTCCISVIRIPLFRNMGEVRLVEPIAFKYGLITTTTFDHMNGHWMDYDYSCINNQYISAVTIHDN